MTDATARPDLRAAVRYACECAALAAWLEGRYDERPTAAAECADRGDWRGVKEACGGICVDHDHATPVAHAASYAYSAAAWASCVVEGHHFWPSAVRAAMSSAYGDALAAGRVGPEGLCQEQCARRARELGL